jgi:hypothetical protein
VGGWGVDVVWRGGWGGVGGDSEGYISHNHVDLIPLHKSMNRNHPIQNERSECMQRAELDWAGLFVSRQQLALANNSYYC